jgi:hypothetical protein
VGGAAGRAGPGGAAQDSGVEAILAEAALANAQPAVAKAVLADLQLPPEASSEDKAAAAQQAQELIEEITNWLVFGRVPSELKQGRHHPKSVAVCMGSLSDLAKDGNSKDRPASPLPSGQVVQLAFL